MKTPTQVIRVVRGQLTQALEQDLTDIARQFQIDDTGFVFDLFLLLRTRGRGLRGQSYVTSLAQKMRVKLGGTFAGWRKQIGAHFGALFRMRTQKYFIKMADMDPLDATEKTLALMRELYEKDQPAKCQTCPMIASCEFGKQLAGVDPHQLNQVALDKSLPYQDGCKSPPNAGPPQQMQSLVMFIAIVSDQQAATVMAGMLRQKGDVDAALVVEQMAGLAPVSTTNPMKQSGSQPPITGMSTGLGIGKVGYFDASFTGQQLFAGMDKLVKALTHKQLAVFELNRVFRDEIESRSKRKLQEAPSPEDEIDVNRTDNTAKIMRALPSEMALDDESFDTKLATGELAVVEYQQHMAKRNLLYILLDVSGSMQDQINANVYSLLSRGNLAATLSLGLIKRSINEKGMTYFRFFADGCNRLRIAKTKDELIDLSRMVGLADMNGGGTEIMKALETAATDIRTRGDKHIARAEVVLITDGQSEIDGPRLKKIMKGVKLHVFDCYGANVGKLDAHRDALKSVAHSMFHIDPNSLDVGAIIDSVTKE